MTFDKEHAKKLCEYLHEYAHPGDRRSAEEPEPLEAPLGSMVLMLEQAVERIEELERSLVNERAEIVRVKNHNAPAYTNWPGKAQEQLQKEGLL